MGFHSLPAPARHATLYPGPGWWARFVVAVLESFSRRPCASWTSN